MLSAHRTFRIVHNHIVLLGMELGTSLEDGKLLEESDLLEEESVRALATESVEALDSEWDLVLALVFRPGKVLVSHR